MHDQGPPATVEELQRIADGLAEPQPPRAVDPGLAERVEAIARRLDVVTSERRKLEEEEKFLRKRLGAILAPGSHRAGDFSISVRRNLRFDESTALEVLTPEEIALCTVQTLSASRAREVLPEERYVLCRATSGDPIVRVS